MKKILEAKLLEKILKIFHNSNYIIANHFNVENWDNEKYEDIQIYTSRKVDKTRSRSRGAVTRKSVFTTIWCYRLVPPYNLWFCYADKLTFPTSQHPLHHFLK